MSLDPERVKRRYERERSARMQAELIAEKAISDLTAANRVLDQRVADRTADLEATLARLEAADTAKNTFLRGLAHEMSTPLHAITGLVELIETQTDDDMVRDAASRAGSTATRLNSALRTLLEFAAASSGDIVPNVETVALGNYADRIVERWRLRAARAGILLGVDVVPDPTATVDVDPDRLDQIVDALLDNAIRFGAVQARVELTRSERPEPWLRVDVTDQGSGVPEDIGDRIFEAFVRGDNTTEGFGVGLTLARAIAEALDGTVEVAHDQSGGHFVVELPAG